MHRLLGLTSLLLISAHPSEPRELLRANNLARQGQLVLAQQAYEELAASTTDPGLIAFNRGRLLYESGDLRAAELEFQRTAEDRSAPALRRSRAFYNWGVCRLLQGQSASDFRTAIACLNQSVALAGEDPTLQKDARHNLELAKWLWARAGQKEAKPPRASDQPDNAPRPDPPARQQPDARPGREPALNADTRPNQQPANPQAQRTTEDPGKSQAPTETAQKQPGPGSKPVLLDPERADPLTREQAQQLLRDAAQRIARDRRGTARLVAGPDRPHVRDW